MAIFYEQQEDRILVTGKTYPYREAIKALGGRFQGDQRCWSVPGTDPALEKIRELCRRVGGGPAGKGKTPPSRAAATSAPSPNSSGAVPTGISARSVDADLNKAGAAPGLSVADLLDKVGLAIRDTFPRSVWVIGEIQNIAHRKQGVFLQLAEPGDARQHRTLTVSASIWQSALRHMVQKHGKEVPAQILQDGLRVRLLCQVNLYRDRGQVSLAIQDLDPAFTKGSLALAREQLLKELRQKGLDRKNKLLALPVFPFRVGLISAEGSRAKSDFTHQLLSQGYAGEIVFFAAGMQGEATLREVQAGLRHLQEAGVDLIVITRGGGSLADLRWFDSRELALAVANCTLPVIAAIGHHEDVCVVEEICRNREKTPTAAAEFILRLFQQARERMDRAATSLAVSLRSRLDQVSTRQAGLSQRLQAVTLASLAAGSQRQSQLQMQLTRAFTDRWRSTLTVLEDRQLRLHQSLWQGTSAMAGRITRAATSLPHLAMAKIPPAVQKLVSRREGLEAAWRLACDRHLSGLNLLGKELTAHDPKPWFQKGWTKLSTTAGPVRSINQVSTGDPVRAVLEDGILDMTVNHREKRHPEEANE